MICLVGPTGTGKTGAALAVARRTPSGVVNFDSRQVYADFPLITAQPEDRERAVCPHLLYGFLECAEVINAARFTDMAKEAVAEVRAMDRLPLLVGGTGLYLRSLLQGIAPIPEIPAEIRRQVLDRVATEGPQPLHAELEKIDPDYAAKIHPNDSQRNARAAGVFTATGRTMTWWHTHGDHGQPPFDSLKIGIRMDLDALTPRLAARIDLMLEHGGVEEARAAWAKCPDPNAPGWTGIGCAELLAYVRGEADLETTRRTWVHNTRLYAKRQFTWFNKDKHIEWFEVGQAEAVADRVLAWIKGRNT